MPRVYIPCDTGLHDFQHTAGRFGEVVVITTGVVDRLNVRQVFQTFREAMATSQADDYVVCVGLHVLTGMAMSIQAARHGRLNLLQWTRDGYAISRLLIDGGTPAPSIYELFDALPDGDKSHLVDELADRLQRV